MSHSLGHADFEDGLRLFFEYDGTCDIATPALRDSILEVQGRWRQMDDARCSCGGEDEAVRLHADYGDGFSWPGRACRACKAITAGFDPFLAEDGVDG